MAYDNTYLLDMIEKKAAVPTNQNTFSPAEILELATDAIIEEILPDLLKSRQEFLVVWEDLTPTKLSGDNYHWIRIPYRAVGQSIISVCRPEDDDEIDQTFYWVENNKIYFEDQGLTTYRIRYYLRPGHLVEASAVGTISNIDTVTGIITTTARPTSFTTSLNYDFVRGKAGFDILAKDKACSALPTTTGMTFTASDLPSELAVGDYVCISDQSPVPQIPVEWFPFLASYTAALILNSIGDVSCAVKMEGNLPRLKANALNIIAPRVERKSKAIIARS